LKTGNLKVRKEKRKVKDLEQNFQPVCNEGEANSIRIDPKNGGWVTKVAKTEMLS